MTYTILVRCTSKYSKIYIKIYDNPSKIQKQINIKQDKTL